MRVLIASSLIVSAYSVTSTSTVTNTNIYSPEDIEFWHQFCHDAVDDSSYCKYNHVPSLCQFSLIACGPSLLTTAGSLPPTDPTTASMVTTVPVTTTEAPSSSSELPVTPTDSPVTTEPANPAPSTSQVSSTVSSGTTTANVVTSTDSITTSVQASTTDSCESSDSCSPDPEGAIEELVNLLGSSFVLTGGAMPNVYMPQFTYITPAAVVRPGTAEDIAEILSIALKHRVPVVVRSYAGHSYAGQSTVQDGIVILMDRFSNVEVLPEGFLGSSYTAVVGAGTRQLDIYVALMQHSPPLGVPGGNCPSVSMAGVTQGGAHGYYGTKYGTLADVVIAADVVVKQDGSFKLVRATRDGEHAELLKALRGGMGGNYGVVVNWYVETFRASDEVRIFRHKVDPSDKSKAEMIAKVRAFEEAVTSQPGDGLWAKFKVKGGFDMNFEGMCMCEPISNECGDCNVAMDSVDSALDKDNWVTSPSELVTDHGYATWSWAGCTEWADPRTPASAEYPGVSGDFSGAAKGCYDYDASLSVNSPWKSISVYIKHSDATESFWNTVWDIVHEPECEDRNVCILTFEYYGGKMLQEPQDCSGAGPCTSFIHRSHGWNIQISSLWSKGDSGGENVAISWVAKAFATLDAKSSLHTSYQNYLSNQWTVSPWKVRYFPGQDVQPDHWKYRFFGDSIYSRLQQVKCDYNPDNLFVTADTADIVVQLPDDCST